ncbi:MAG: FemAB family PEP-CTERM system-associated protein [Magnetococcus sp. WYHC-3]
MSRGLRLRPMVPEDAPAWDRFVEAHPQGTFFHLSPWPELIRRGFGQPSHALLVEQDGCMAGVLPLVRQRSRLFGDALVSTPFCVAGGILAQDEAARECLLQGAVALARRLGVHHLELRENAAPPPPGWQVRDLYCGFRKTFSPDPQANLLAIPRKQRAEVRKGVERGLDGVVDGNVDGAWLLYSESLRNLGTPVFPRRWLRLLAQAFAARMDVLTVRHQGKPVSAVVNFYFRDQVLPYYGGGGHLARALGANHFMYWHLMTHAASRGAQVFDFGRSKVGSGSYEFKRLYGFSPQPLAYACLPITRAQVAEVNPNNPRYRHFIALWKRLPLPVSRLLGPVLARRLG